MKRVLKYFLFTLTGLLALIGFGTCLLITNAVVSLRQHGEDQGPKPYVGAAYATSYAWEALPLPWQEDTQNFPMAMDYQGMCDYTGFIIFRASADWQEAFCKLYPYEERCVYENAHDRAREYAERMKQERMQAFISDRQWQVFHAGCVRPGSDYYFTAFRDESGKYVLLYLWDH